VEVGKRADLVLVDYRAFGLTPTLDPVQNLVYHAHARDVELVLVDGRVVVEDRRVVAVDAAELVDRAQDASTAAWARFVAKHGGIMAA
jgi:5-methylthioadenosine/S-adenosylhomocysteine deaminase